MSVTKIVGILLIIAAIALGYMGITTFQESTASAKILGVELSASDEGGQITGFLYIGLAIVMGLGGIYLAGRKA